MDLVTPARTWAVAESADGDESHPVERMPPLQTVVMFCSVVGPILGLLTAIFLLWHRAPGKLSIGWAEILVMATLYLLIGFSVTIGYHRLLTHKSFETYRPVKWLLAILASSAGQGMCIRWVATHRRHHQQADREGDPHSPHLHGEGFFAMLSGMLHAHVMWCFDKDKDDLGRSVPDLLADPVLVWIDALYFFWVGMSIVIPGIILGLMYHSWYGFFSGAIWGGVLRICLMQHATWSVNSICHVWGSRRFSSSDHSTNNLPVALVSLGEGWHNNHHAFPTSARHGMKWYEFDASWVVISCMKLVGLAWNVRVPSPAAMAARSINSQKRPEAAPMESAPMESAPMEIAPMEVAPMEVAPMEVAPMEIALVEPAAFEAAAG